MSDIATLTCPNCGGILDIAARTATVFCGWCGNGYSVRRDVADMNHDHKADLVGLGAEGGYVWLHYQADAEVEMSPPPGEGVGSEGGATLPG